MDFSSPTRNAKNPKVRLEQNFDEGRSRLCSLPDVVLHHILSFLPTEEAVRTSILSKRWRFMWTSLTKLDFNEQGHKFNDAERARRRRNFVNFVERVLLLSESSIEEFLLFCDGYRINYQIAAAGRHKVQRLTLNFSGEIDEKIEESSFMLPHCLFTCESLKELDLELPYVLRIPSYIFFPSLKSLSLNDIIFPDDHSAQQLFSACPKLVKLFLVYCSWKNVNAVCISGPMLETVVISDDTCNLVISDDTCNQSCQFIISGKNLKSLSYIGELENDLCIFDAPSLDKASFSLLGTEYMMEGDRMRAAAYRGFKLLMGLANVKSLEVSPSSLQLLACADELLSHLPSLYNLKNLVVWDYDEPLDFACRGLMSILHNSPQLETISFVAEIKLSAYHENHDWTIDPVPPCFLTHLWGVKLRVFNASDEELHVLKTLLTTARALEEILLPSEAVNKMDDLLPLRSNNPLKRVVFF